MQTAPEVFRLYRQAWREGFKPEPLLTVSAWADRHRYLSTRNAAEPGRWRTSRTPYLREIMDSLSTGDPTERVVVMKGAQIGLSEAGNCWIGYIFAQAPGPVLAVLPTVELAKRTSRQRIDPLIEDSPALRGLVRPARERDSGNTMLSKIFAGGVLVLTGANSAVGLRSMPARFLFLDEVDAYPPDADGEGDPIALAIERTATFARRKIFMISTPTIAGSSRIEAAFAESDQRRYWVPCLDCGEFQTLKWANVKWTKGAPLQAGYACEACGTVMPNHRKPELLARGEWRAEAQGDGRTRGYHLSSLYSPWKSWGQAAVEFLAAKDSEIRLKSWVNLTLGETFAERGEAPEWRRLYDRREPYAQGTVPAGGLFLTAGADVQADRIEVEIVAWGPGGESWSVDYRLALGQPHDGEVWHDLNKLLIERFPHALGKTLTIGRLAIDSGYSTNAVYQWARAQSIRQVMCVKGTDALRTAIGAPTPVDVTVGGRKIAAGLRLWSTGSSVLKQQLYGLLRQERPVDPAAELPPGFCHFPEYGQEFFEQLCAEQLVRRTNKRGFITFEWVKTRPRNEALDARIYATAAAEACGVPRWSADVWAALRAELAAEAPPAPAMPQVIRSKWLER